MKLKNGTKIKVHSTNSNIIEKLECKIVGIANYFGDCGGNIYVVKPINDIQIEGYETFCLSDACMNICDGK